MKHYLLLLFLATGLCACVDENSNLGHTLVNSSFYNVYVDTCTVDISTVLEDSIVTRGDSICQIGHYLDETWGEVTATYYTEYSTVSFTPEETYSYTLDSLVLIMRHSGHYWGDTLTSPLIHIYRLENPIELSEDEDLYNHTRLSMETTPVCSFTYRPRPGEAEVHEIRLPDEWGQQLLDDLVNQEEYLETQEDFKREFPGLAFVPDATGQCISGFLVNDSSMCLTLRYHEVSTERTEQEITFSVNTEYAYTGIQHDCTDSPLSEVQSGIENYVHSTSLAHKAYLQGLTGYYNQLEFPYLNDLQDAGQNAVRLTRELSAGIQLGMVLGTVTQSETQESATVEYESKKRAFHAELGLHYDFPSRQGTRWSIGAIFAPSLPLAHDNTLTYDNSSTSEELEKSYHEQQQYLPLHLGLGVALGTGHWLLAAEYNYTDWSRNTSSHTGIGYENQHRMNLGGCYTLYPRRPRSIELMTGIGYGNSYIHMRGRKMNYLEASAGISIPIRYSYLSVGVSWRQQMNRDSRVMQECLWSLDLNLTFGERISKSKIK